MDLAEFLLARLAEDFEVAQRENTWPNGKPISAADWDRVAGDADSMLVSMFSPARVLAEVESKRGMVELHQTQFADGDPYQRCLADGADYPCATLKLLALPYADHPECHPSWLPAVKA